MSYVWPVFDQVYESTAEIVIELIELGVTLTVAVPELPVPTPPPETETIE